MQIAAERALGPAGPVGPAADIRVGVGPVGMQIAAERALESVVEQGVEQPAERVAGKQAGAEVERALGPAESVAALELVVVAALPVTDLRNCRKILLHHYLRNRN